MDKNEFVKKYTDFVKLATVRLEKATKEGLLALEDELDHEKIYERDIFEYGIMLVLNGYEDEFIGEILINITNQEKDEFTKLYKNIQSLAVYGIQHGYDVKRMYYMLNSLSGLSFKDDPVKDFITKRTEYLFPT